MDSIFNVNNGKCVAIFSNNISENEKCYSVTSICAPLVSITPPNPDKNLCDSFCSPCGCGTETQVFGCSDKDIQNDVTNLFFEKNLSTDFICYTLVSVATRTEYKLGGSIDIGSTSENNGFVTSTIEWDKVIRNIGGGRYYIKTDLTTLGQTYSNKSENYLALKFDECSASSGVLIEWKQTGFFRDGRDFCSSENEYNFSLRLQGELNISTPDYESEFYQDKQSNLVANNIKVVPNYKLLLTNIDSQTAKLIIKNFSLSDEIRVTSFDLSSKIDERQLVIIDTIDDFSSVPGTNGCKIEMTLKDKKQDLERMGCC